MLGGRPRVLGPRGRGPPGPRRGGGGRPAARGKACPPQRRPSSSGGGPFARRVRAAAAWPPAIITPSPGPRHLHPPAPPCPAFMNPIVVIVGLVLFVAGFFVPGWMGWVVLIVGVGVLAYGATMKGKPAAQKPQGP